MAQTFASYQGLGEPSSITLSRSQAFHTVIFDPPNDIIRDDSKTNVAVLLYRFVVAGSASQQSGMATEISIKIQGAEIERVTFPRTGVGTMITHCRSSRLVLGRNEFLFSWVDGGSVFISDFTVFYKRRD